MKLKMVLLKRRTKAFTLAETIVITFIVAFLALIPPLYLKGYQESLDLLNAKRIFHTVVNATARQAAITNRVKIIDYDANKRQISVRDGKYKTKRYNLPENINISGLPLNISKDGNLSPKTVVISNDRDKTNIRIQMMWGKIIDD